MYSETFTPTLVVIVNNRRDWQRIVDERWYRIPVRHSPPLIAAAFLAFYHTRVFGDHAWRITWIAPVQGYAIVQRRTLLPHERSHPRADGWYYRIDVGALQQLARPLLSRRLRRITFIPTTLERLMAADDVSDLWIVDDLTPLVWTTFRDAAVKATRRLELEERQTCDLAGESMSRDSSAS